MSISFQRFAALPALLTLAAGLTLAQPPAGHGPGGPGGHLSVLAQHLNLTADQQAQAKIIFEQMTTAAAPIHEQLKALQTQITAAIKANDQAQLAQLGATQGSLMGQAETLHLQAQGKFYAILTPAQQSQFEAMFAGGHGMGMGMGPAMMRHHQ